MLLRNRTFLVTSSSLFVLALSVSVQAQTASPSIYSCTDSRGRTITADRPIAACADREQRELGPSGTLRRTLEPTYTLQEQAEREEHARQAALQASRIKEERRRERALVMRYPNQTVHEQERSRAMLQINAVIDAARKRLGELATERQSIDDEMEFYNKDPSKAPPSLRRKLKDSEESAAIQNRFIAAQEDEKRRVNARFDEERAQLKPLWATSAGAGR